MSSYLYRAIFCRNQISGNSVIRNNNNNLILSFGAALRQKRSKQARCTTKKMKLCKHSNIVFFKWKEKKITKKNEIVYSAIQFEQRNHSCVLNEVLFFPFTVLIFTTKSQMNNQLRLLCFFIHSTNYSNNFICMHN